MRVEGGLEGVLEGVLKIVFEGALVGYGGVRLKARHMRKVFDDHALRKDLKGTNKEYLPQIDANRRPNSLFPVPGGPNNNTCSRHNTASNNSLTSISRSINPDMHRL